MEELRKKCEVIRKMLMKDLKRGVTYSYGANGTMQFNIYINEYDYVSIGIKENKESIETIVETIKHIYNNRIAEEFEKYYSLHKATILEKAVVDLMAATWSEMFYVIDGELNIDGSFLAWDLSNIEEYKIYDSCDGKILSFEDSDGKWDIDFGENEILLNNELVNLKDY